MVLRSMILLGKLARRRRGIFWIFSQQRKFFRVFMFLDYFFRVQVPGSGPKKTFYVLGLFFTGFGALYPTRPEPVPVIHWLLLATVEVFIAWDKIYELNT